MSGEFRTTMSVKQAVWVTETLVYAGGTRVEREVNMGVGSLFLTQTYPWSGSPWNDYERDIMNWAACRVESVDFGGGGLSFVVIGHLAAYGENGRDALFARVGEMYVAQSWPEDALVFTLGGEDHYRKAFNQTGMFTLLSPQVSPEEYVRYTAMRTEKEQKAGRTVNPGNTSLADLFFDSPPEEGLSYSSKDDMKWVQDYQGNMHRVRSTYAVKYLSFMNLFYRIMEEGKREAIIRTDTEYDHDAWNDAIDSYRLCPTVAGMDVSTATLCEGYKLENMPLMLDEKKVDRARLCQWKSRDLTWLSITDFHEAPHGLQDRLKGTDRAGRLYLVGCVKGYLTFLRVMFFSGADSLLSRLIAWLERPDSPFEKPANTEYVRCRIDGMLVDFWSEVRSNKRVSRRYPTACDFQCEGAVWALLAMFEQSLFDQMAMEEYSHIRFYEKPQGEFWRIRGGGKSVMEGVSQSSSEHSFRQSQLPTSRPTSSSGGGLTSICPYHLAWRLQVKKNDGTHMGACQYVASCRFPHVDLDTITVAQATGALHNCKPSMVTKVSAAIIAKGNSFKA